MNSKDRDRAPMGDPGADGTAPEPPATPSPPARPPRRTLAVGAVMVLCGVLLSTTARLAGGGSIRDDSGDVAGGAEAVQEALESIIHADFAAAAVGQ